MEESPWCHEEAVSSATVLEAPGFAKLSQSCYLCPKASKYLTKEYLGRFHIRNGNYGLG